MDRRTLLAMALAPMFPRLKQVRFKIGDWVRIVALPSYTVAFGSSKERDLRRHAWILRRCLGRRYQIVYIGNDGRPELDVSRAISTAMGALSYSISIEPECVLRTPLRDVTA